MKRNAQNNSIAPGAIGTAKNKLNKLDNLLKLKTMRTFRLLAFFALFGSVGYALASNQQSICENPAVESYRQIDADLPPTSAPGTDPNMLAVGRYLTNFTCTENQNVTCHYVYAPTHENQVNGWVKCEGNYIPNP